MKRSECSPRWVRHEKKIREWALGPFFPVQMHPLFSIIGHPSIRDFCLVKSMIKSEKISPTLVSLPFYVCGVMQKI